VNELSDTVHRPKIKVLVVDDTAAVRKFLAYVLNEDPEVDVIGAVASGADALAFIARRPPDAITMDIDLPGMDGFETTRRIMATHPVPVVIVSGSHVPSDMARMVQAVEAGAVTIMPRPWSLDNSLEEPFAREFVQTVKLASQVEVVPQPLQRFRGTSRLCPAAALVDGHPGQVIGIGASTGGPQVIQAILAELPPDLPAPVLIVQHIASGFVTGFVEWISATSRLPVCLATAGQRLLRGHAYVAPDDQQMGVSRSGSVALRDDPPEYGLRPTVGYLFRSLAEVYGAHTIAVLLSGMGRDGADELLLLKQAGALTIAQDKGSSVVHGMPGAAIQLGAARYVLPPGLIAQALSHLAARTEEDWR